MHRLCAGSRVRASGARAPPRHVMNGRLGTAEIRPGWESRSSPRDTRVGAAWPAEATPQEAAQCYFMHRIAGNANVA
jgi:hypothetical protein